MVQVWTCTLEKYLELECLDFSKYLARLIVPVAWERGVWGETLHCLPFYWRTMHNAVKMATFRMVLFRSSSADESSSVVIWLLGVGASSYYVFSTCLLSVSNVWILSRASKSLLYVVPEKGGGGAVRSRVAILPTSPVHIGKELAWLKEPLRVYLGRIGTA